MNSFFLIIIMLMSTEKLPTVTFDNKLLEAIIEVESGGNPNAVGDNGRAVGVLQIWPIMVEDCNRILGREEFTLGDRWSRSRSIEMFWTYTNHYSRGESREVISRNWNGGPNGHNKDVTIPYWLKVKEKLNEHATS